MQITEEILMRIGVDSRAVSTGLNRVSAYVRGWGVSLAHHMKGAVGAFLGVAAAERAFDGIKERILKIKALVLSTGFGSNFIQGVMLKLGEGGESIEKLEKPLQAITALAGMKGESSIKLLGDLAERYKNLNTQEERNLMLKGLGIKSWEQLIPLLEEGRHGIEKMNQASVFKISPDNVGAASGAYAGTKGFASRAGGLMANLGLDILRGWMYTAAVVSNIFRPSSYHDAHAFLNNVYRDVQTVNGEMEKTEQMDVLKAIAKQNGMDVTQLEQKAIEEENTLLQEQLKLRNEIADRGKDSVAQLAAEARRLTGAIKPQNYSITERMKLALRIDDEETRAKLDWQRGKVSSPLDSPHWSEAQAIRNSSGWMTAADRDPTQAQVYHLAQISEKLENIKPVAEMARMVTKESK